LRYEQRRGEEEGRMRKSVDELKAYVLSHITWLGQSTVRIATSAGRTVIFDPFNVKAEAGPADLVLITHPHTDHLDRGSLAAVSGKDTALVAPLTAGVAGALGVSPGQTLTVGPFEITAVPAYNIARPFHPKSSNWVGYVIVADGLRIYHAGDTDNIPEMTGLAPDICFLPVGGLFTMSCKKAAAAAAALESGLSIPIHYNALVGGKAAGQKFCRLVGPASMVLTPAG
jgi:L-ascorbate metabolism protein UlaG (beta-lactamase superfamily)